MNYFQYQGKIVTELELRSLINAMLPEVITASVAKGLGATPVLESPPPPITSNQIASKTGNVIKDELGNIVWEWKVTKLPAKTIADNLTNAKSSKTAYINQIRDQLEADGFSYMGKVIDSDPRSVLRINSASLAAMAALTVGEHMTISWTAKDNTSIDMDSNAIIEMPVALAVHADSLHKYAKSLKALVADATTVEDVIAIDVNQGWPK